MTEQNHTRGSKIDLGPLMAEIDRIEESAKYSAQGQLEQVKIWRGANILLGAPAAGLAALSGASALAETLSSTWVGFIALAAAALGATHTTLNASSRQDSAQAAGNAYLAIQTGARQLRTVDLPHIPYEEARTQLAELTARRDEVNKTAEPFSARAYKRAKKNIERGGQTYATDDTRRRT